MVDILSQGFLEKLGKVSEQYPANVLNEVKVKGVGDFLFSTNDECSIELESDITDHYVESGVAIQDHIVMRPERITLSGYIGEHIYTNPYQGGLMQGISAPLQALTQFTPSLSSAATKVLAKVQEKINLATAVAGYAVGTYNTVKSTVQKLLKIEPENQSLSAKMGVKDNRQTVAFRFFSSLWASRTTMMVITPYRVYESMAIEKIQMIQTGQTADESKLTITFKKIRIAETQLSMLKPAKKQSQQSSPVVNKGLTSGKEVPLMTQAQSKVLMK